MQTKTFRLFISSTFSDFTKERELLQTEVFPYISNYCEEYGFQFQPVDLRWGVNEEAQLDQKTLDVCLDEVKACKSYPHPNFLIMAGDRYGWVPNPYMIEQKEFENILSYIEKNNKDFEIEYWLYRDKDNSIKQSKNRLTNSLELLKQWYELDENQIPVSYVLQKRTDRSKNSYVDYTVYENWAPEENALRTTLQLAAKNIGLSKVKGEKYFISATEHEVKEGIINYFAHTEYQKKLIKNNHVTAAIDKKYVFGLIRNIVNKQKFKNDLYIENNKIKVNVFKSNIRKYLLDDNCLDIDTRLIDDNRLELSYLKVFKQSVISFLIDSIKEQIDQFNEITKLEEELYEQNYYLTQKIKFFSGRKGDLKVINDYINDASINSPLIVYGKSGLGKSSLMAKAINELIIKDSRRVIFRFIGATPQSSDTKSILLSILQELGVELNNIESNSLEDFSLKSYQALIELKDEVVIFIDAVDQFCNKDTFMWLPEKLPNNLKIILTTLKDENYPEDSKYYELLSNYHNNFYQLKQFEIDSDVVNLMLKDYNRTINYEQMQYVLNKYNEVQSPLYLKVAVMELIYWRSYDQVYQNIQLENSQRGIIKKYISNLVERNNHKNILIEKVMSYIYASIEGLSEKELLDFLSMDKSLLNEVASDKFHKNLSNKLPVAIWVRLQYEIKTFISIKTIEGVGLMQFFHREFNDAIKETFDTQFFHRELIDYSCTKVLQNHHPFSNNRFGKLLVTLLVNYAFLYDQKLVVEEYLKKLAEKNIEWLQDFVSYLDNTLNNYYKSGQTIEALFISKIVYSNKFLFDNLKNKFNFISMYATLELATANTENAEKLYGESLKFARSDYNKAIVEIQLAKTYRKKGETEVARKMLEKNLKHTLTNNSDERADALIQLGLCHFGFKEYDKALEYYKLADNYLTTTDNRQLKLYNWLGMSTVIAFMGKVLEGLDLLIKIKNESQQYGFQNFYIDSLNGISKKYLMLDEYKKAIEYASEALFLGKKQDNKILVYLMNGYILEGYAGLYKSKKHNQEEIETHAKKYLDDIIFDKNNRVVKEKLILELVDECIEKWNMAIE